MTILANNHVRGTAPSGHTPKATRYFSTAQAQDTRLGFYLAAYRGDGDVVPLLALADWLEEHDRPQQAARVRKDALNYASKPGRTVTGESWLQWHAAWHLGLMADSAAKAVGYARFGYRGNYTPDESFVRADGSLEAAAVLGGVVPRLDPSRKRQARLALVMEALDLPFEWVE